MAVTQQFIVEVGGETQTLTRPEAVALYEELAEALGVKQYMEAVGALAEDLDEVLSGIEKRTYDIAEAIGRLEEAQNGHWLQENPVYESGEEFLASLDEPDEVLTVEEAAARMQVRAAIQESASTQRNPGSGIGNLPA